MKIKQILATLAYILALSMAQPAAALTIDFAFDPTGGGAGAIHGKIDQEVGNAIAIGGVSAIGNFLGGGSAAGNVFTLAYQANLAVISGGTPGNPVYANGTGGNFFHFTLQFEEEVVAVTGGDTVEFKPTLAGTNIFTMYRSDALADDLTGAGFGVGTAILTAEVTSSVFSNFKNSGAAAVDLDQFGPTNDWGSTTTTTGNGNTSLNLKVTGVDASYFPDLEMADFLTISLFNTGQITPFTQVDPSQNFLWTAGGPTASNVGNVNGFSGPDFLFQADGNQSFDKKPIPEPAQIMLFGLGLAGLSLARKKRA